jgi:hypothetical protein
MKAPAFQFYASDFLSDINVVTMSMSQRGIYITLIAHEWLEGKLPADTSTLKMLCGNPEDWESDWEKVSTCFTERDGYIYNSRLESEREKLSAYRERMSKAGKKGADKRWHSQAIAKPSIKKKKKEVEDRSNKIIKGIEKEFEEKFWLKYPRKHAKIEARKSFVKARKTFSLENIMLGLKMYIKYWANTGKEVDYVPMASTWLNQERFIDVSIDENNVVKHVNEENKETTLYCQECENAKKFIDKSVAKICDVCGDGMYVEKWLLDHEKNARKLEEQQKSQQKTSTELSDDDRDPARRASSERANSQPASRFEKDFKGLVKKMKVN